MSFKAISANGVDWGHYFQLVVRQRWLVLAPTLIAALTFAVLSFREPDQYKATAMMLVEPQSLPTAMLRSTLPYGPETYVRTLVEQIKSPSRLGRVIDEFGLYSEIRNQRTMEEVVALMRSRIEVERHGPDTFSVSFTGDDPYQVQAVTNRLTDIFIQENIDFRLARVTQNVAFLKGQADELRQQVATQERRIQQFKSENLDRLPEQRSPLETQLSASQDRLQSVTESLLGTRVKLSSAQDRIAMLHEDQRLESVPATTSEPVPSDPRVRLATVQKELRELRAGLSERHPDVRSKARELAGLEAQLASAGTPPRVPKAQRRRGPTSPELLRAYEEQRLAQEDINRLEAQQVRLQEEIAALSQRMDDIPRVELELSQLSSGLDVLKEQADSFQKKASEADATLELEKASQGSQFRALDRARRPTRPISPNRPMWALSGALGGAGVGIAVIVLLDLIFRPFFSEEDLAVFSHVQILVSIPHIGPLPSEWHRVGRQLVSLLDLLRSSAPLGAISSFPAGSYQPPEPLKPRDSYSEPALTRPAHSFSYLVGEPQFGDRGPEVVVPFDADDALVLEHPATRSTNATKGPYAGVIPGVTLPPGHRASSAPSASRDTRRTPDAPEQRPGSRSTSPTETLKTRDDVSAGAPEMSEANGASSRTQDSAAHPAERAVPAPADQNTSGLNPLQALLWQLESREPTKGGDERSISPETARSSSAADVSVERILQEGSEPDEAVQSLAEQSADSQKGSVNTVPVATLNRMIVETSARIVAVKQRQREKLQRSGPTGDVNPTSAKRGLFSNSENDLRRYSILASSPYSMARSPHETTKELGRRAPWADDKRG